MTSLSTTYATYSAEDKAALKELKEYMSAKVGKDVSLADAIASVEPDMQTPDYLTAY